MDCDNDIFITTPIKSVISPNYPDPYGNNLDCQLTLSFEEGVAIRIDILNIDKGGLFKKGCKYDWLEIHDGKGSDSKIIGSKICGKIPPDPSITMTSTGSSMTFVFHSDKNHIGSGFEINIQ